MVFEIGKCYRHNGGEEISIIGELETTLYGKCLISESNRGWNLKPVGRDEDAAENWKEITVEEWMQNFS